MICSRQLTTAQSMQKKEKRCCCLRRKGYITDFTGKHWRIRLPQYEHFTRLDTLDERWTPENIRLGRYASFGNRRAYISYPPQMPQELSDWFRPFHKTSHIYKLYLHYCYLLGYLPKHTDYTPTSPYSRQSRSEASRKRRCSVLE